MKKIFSFATLLLLVVCGLKCVAQDDDRALLKQVVKENQEAVDAIAMYPRDTRKIIFEAAEYPEVIAKLNAMQKNSQAAFEKLISPFSKEEQENIWNLTRYDGLISDLATKPIKSDDEINKILVNYPEEIHKTATEEGKSNHDLLVQINKMNNSFDSTFEQLMTSYPPGVTDVFKQMINMPEVLTILFDHMQYTVVIGDYYKKNPERVLHKTDSLNLVLTQKNAQEADDWKQSLTDNPQAQEEYTQVAKEYAQDNGYQPEDYAAPLTPDVTNYNSYSYNWWYGYPSWYPYGYWNPYPYWYDWGFYYGPGGRIIFFGMPSSYFMDWYFYYPEHFRKYPELSDHYYNYYHRHPESRNYNSISHSVNDWRIKNKDIVTDAWDKDDVNRTKRFKEYGQMEVERNKYNAEHPKQQIEKTEFLQNKQEKYPLLSTDVSKKQLNQRNSKAESIKENTSEPVKKPPVAIPEHYKANVNGQPDNNVKKQPDYAKPKQENSDFNGRPNNVNPQRNSKPVKPAENVNQTRDAQQYHENTWQQIEPQKQPEKQPQQKNDATPTKQEEKRQAEQPVKENNHGKQKNKRE